MEEKIQEAVKFFNDKFGLKKEVKSGEISFPKCRSVKIRVGAARTKHIVDLYCESNEDFEKLKNIIKNDKEMNDIYKEVSGSRCFTVENQSIKEQCRLLGNLYDKWQSFSSSSKKTQSADAEPNVKKACDKYNYEPCDEQFPAYFDGNVKLGIVNNKFVEIQNVASFADWSHDFQNNLNKIEGNTILLGLNISSSIGKPWGNFHSTSNEDKRLKYACEGVFDRAYITDLIKDFPNGKSSEAMDAFKNNETLRHASVEMFVREIAFLIHCGLIEKNKPLYTVLLGSAVQECMECEIAQKKIKDIICDEINNLGCKKIIFGKAYHYAFRKCSMLDDQANKEYREQFKRLKEKMTHAGNEEVVDNPHCFLKKGCILNIE